jgi:outer membrane receptor protein involved in Fe transport
MSYHPPRVVRAIDRPNLTEPGARRPALPSAALAFVLALALVLGASTASAQTGKLAGTITDEFGDPLIGATALIVGTQPPLGAAADLSGDYAILRVPVGTVSVRFSSVGYQTQVVEGVLIRSNQTTELDVTLGEEVIVGEEIVVTAERPLVDISQTSAMATISKEEIDVLPVQELADLVNLQAGVVDGHFRGGRIGEVQYQVEGVSVNNPYDNSSSVTLDRSVLQEVQVISGTFDAEYGQALSGVVNAVLRSGDPDQYEFSFEAYAGDYVSPGNDSTMVQTRFGRARVPLYPYVEDIDPFALQNVQASFSGPVPLVPSTTFLVNGQRLADEGYVFGERLFVPTDSSFRNEDGEFILQPSGDGELIPLSSRERYSWLGKLSNRSLRNVQLDYQVLGSWEENDGSLNDNYGYRFNPDGFTTRRQLSLVHGIDVTHTLSDNVFYELGLRQNYFDFKDLKYDDPFDPRYFEAGQPVTPPAEGFENLPIVQGVELGRFVQKTNAYVAKGAVTAQATKVHLLKAGAEVSVFDLEFGRPGRVEQVVIDGEQQLGVVQDTLDAVVLSFTPVQAAAFVQDRVEWGDLRVRAGLRLEYFDANATVPSDLQNPANSIDGAPASRSVDTEVKLVLAPRLGVSFPILERASLFFSYGHFYQMPGLENLFNNADYSILEDLQDTSDSAGQKGILGNPDLDPEFTAQYEFGFKSEVTDWLGVDVSLFYKDIRDLLGVEFVQTYTAASYARFTNVDFGGVSGFTVALDQRGLGALSTTLDYTYQVATGNSSDPRETFNRAQAGNDARPRQIPFNWDQRHTLNATAVWFRPDNFAVTGILKLGTGRPYTPELDSNFGADLEPNSGRKETFVTVDLRAEKFFAFGGLDLTGFARVFNLFDAHFTNGFVYADTGSPFYTLNPQQQFNPNPGRLAQPRRVEIGLSFRGAFAARR